MDYEKHYNQLCERAQKRGTRKQDLPFYTEKHRILPGCMGGTYRKDNVALLTPEEHYVAHQLLVKMYPDKGKLVEAAHMMCVIGTGQDDRVNNKQYGWVKRKYASECKKRTGSQNSSYGKSWYHHPETLENGKFHPDDVPAGWVKGRKITSYAYYNSDTEEIRYFSKGNQPAGWVQGNPKSKKHGIDNTAYGKRWYYNPETFETMLCLDKDAPKGWIAGNITHKGTSWYYNSETNKAKRFFPGSQPRGWLKGKPKMMQEG